MVKLRSEKNWNQSDLARACFKDRQSVERLENGKINPSIFYLKEIADALEISVNKSPLPKPIRTMPTAILTTIATF